jgi:hypothetical protein
MAYDASGEVIRFPPRASRVPQPSPLISGQGLARDKIDVQKLPARHPAAPSPVISPPPSPSSRRPRVIVASSLITNDTVETEAAPAPARAAQSRSRLFVPQPRMTVAQARGVRNEHLAEVMMTDRSPYALFQGAPDMAYSTLNAIGNSTSDGTKHGTRSRQD